MNKVIASALVRAQRDVTALPRDGFNKHLGVAYTKAETIITAGRGILARHGLAVIVSDTSISVDGPVTKLAVKFIVSNESGETQEFGRTLPITSSPKVSPTDSAAAADTRLMGYFFRGLLCIPQSDETVDDAGEVTPQRWTADTGEAKTPQRSDVAVEQPRTPPASTNGHAKPAMTSAQFTALLQGIRKEIEALDREALDYEPTKIIESYSAKHAGIGAEWLAMMARAIKTYWVIAWVPQLRTADEFAGMRGSVAEFDIPSDHKTRLLEMLAAGERAMNAPVTTKELQGASK